jgi:hypothetical protein
MSLLSSPTSVVVRTLWAKRLDGLQSQKTSKEGAMKNLLIMRRALTK